MLNLGTTDVPELPEINILSWNYDSQFERSYAEYVQNRNFDEIQNLLRVVNSSQRSVESSDTFKIIKLNGSATAFYTGNEITEDTSLRIHDTYNSLPHRIKIPLPEREYKIDQLKEAFRFYMDVLRTYRTIVMFNDDTILNLRYAWEENEDTQYTQSVTSAICQETTILVVIGYSFPYFNRKVDQFLTDKMTNLSKIIVQAPSESQKGIAEALSAMRDGIMIESAEDCSQFHIPSVLLANPESHHL